MAKPKMWVVKPREMTPITHPVPAAFWGEAIPNWDAEEHLQHHPGALPTLTMGTQTIREANPPPQDYPFPHRNQMGVPPPPRSSLCREAT